MNLCISGDIRVRACLFHWRAFAEWAPAHCMAVDIIHMLGLLYPLLSAGVQVPFPGGADCCCWKYIKQQDEESSWCWELVDCQLLSKGQPCYCERGQLHGHEGVV
jgi:hypothetical protein